MSSPRFSVVAIQVENMHIGGITTRTLAGLISTSHFLFHDCSALTTIVFNRLCGIWKYVEINRPIAVVDQRADVLLEIG